jgi:DNA-binding NarL/FixJ family response regulator
MTIRVFLADDHRILRLGVRALLERERDITVVGEAEDGRKALKLIPQASPDVVLMDISMPGLNGVDVTRQIRKELPEVRVLALSMHTDRRMVSEMLKAGAQGYLVKDCTGEELVKGIRTVARGQTYLCSRAVDVVTRDYVRQGLQGESHAPPALSVREREVLQLLAEGQSTRQIAQALHVSGKTVETHRAHIMRKINARGLADLVKYALREGLITLHQ